MTSATEVLAYVKKSFHTYGRMQRQKILYYTQAWHLAWQGTPLFEEDIQAWEKGPVVPEAWRADKNLGEELVSKFDGKLTTEQTLIVDAVWKHYGRNGGTALSALTHIEEPWIHHYEKVNSFVRGSDVIPKEEMRAYYSMESLANSSAPQKPALDSDFVSDEAILQAIAIESSRWHETLRILADR